MRFDFYTRLICYIVALLDVASKAVVTAHYFDPSSFIDLMQNVAGNTSSPASLTAIPGSNGHSTAYMLQGSRRHLEVSGSMVGRVRQMLQTQEEFTLVAAVRQQQKNSGTIISIQSHDARVLELESSGRRDELRLHYTHRGRLRTEIFPYRLADNQWHLVALSFSSIHVEVFIDCTQIYQRNIRWLREDWPRSMSIWLGQRDAFHAYFKGAIEYVAFIEEPDGILEVCPHANIACPTCSQFRQLQHSIKLLNEKIEELHSKLARAEERIVDLEQCECRLSCQDGGQTYVNGDTWRRDQCTTCTCKNGEVECQTQTCQPTNCSRPYRLSGQCCPTCGSLFLQRLLQKARGRRPGEHCFHKGQRYDDGQSYDHKSMHGSCARCICRNGVPECNEVKCQAPPCPREDQIEVADECCRKCKNAKFCENGHNCHQNATCHNLETRYSCQCKEGFDGDGRTCQDIDECLTHGGRWGHYCGPNTHCVNTIGSYKCECRQGFVLHNGRCIELDECSSNQHNCDSNAICENSPTGSFTCTCKRGYNGDGYTCQPVCRKECQNGGDCIKPNVCRCREGFIGEICEKDLDECRFRMDDCHAHSECINIPGSYFCQCKQGFYSNKADNQLGTLCQDVDECGGWGGGHNCPSGSTCVNTIGSYHCRCRRNANCEGCRDDNNRWHSNGTSWKERERSCEYKTCVNGAVQSMRVECDCSAENVDFQCCPKCKEDGRCRFNGRTYNTGHRWVHECQHCQCLGGEVDCWPMQCPRLSCNNTVTLPGDCCPRCAGIQDPCHALEADSLLGILSQTCTMNSGNYTHGHKWTIMAAECTMCECKGGHVCCQYSQSGCTDLPKSLLRGRHRNRRRHSSRRRRRRADRG